MAISATWIGTGTVQITATGLTNTLADLTNAVADAIAGTQPTVNGALSNITFAAASGVTAEVSSGWTLHDSFTSGIIFTQVFKSLNLDGVSYKNIILRWNIITQELDTSTCESWNATTHTPTNECYTYFNCATLGFKLNQFDLVIMVNPRLICLHNYIGGDVGLWAGVFENMREDVNDTAANGYPCWGWMSSTLWLLGAQSVSSVPIQGNDNPLICMPRTRNGNTGLAAAKTWAMDFGLGVHPYWASGPAPAINYYLGSQQNKFTTTSWDTSKREVLPIKPIHGYTATPTNYGQLMGVKLVSNAGDDMTKLQVSVDSNGNFSNTGTLKDHWLLNTHWRHDQAAGNVWWSNASIKIVKSEYTAAAGERIEYMCSTGNAWYGITASTGNKLIKIDTTNGSSTTIATAGATQFFDIKFDGERFVYFGTGTGLRRLDTQNDTVSSELVIGGGVSTFSINQSHVVCAANTLSATPTITRVIRSTFAVDTTLGSQSLSTFTDSIKIVDAITDYDGNILMVPTIPTTLASNKIVRITPAGAISYIISNPIVHNSGGLFQLDANTVVHAQMVNGSTMYQVQFNPKTATVINITTCGSMPVLNASSKCTFAKIQGVLNAVGRSSAGLTFTTRTSLGGPTANVLPTPVVSENTTTTLSAATQNNFIHTDGCRVFSNNDTGLRVFTGMQAGNTYATVSLGQFAVVA